MKKVLVLCLLLVFSPLVAIAQDNGWKYLKWGMSFEEVRKAIAANEKSMAKEPCNVELKRYIEAFVPDTEKHLMMKHIPKYDRLKKFEDTDSYELRLQYEFGADSCPKGYMLDGKLFGIEVDIGDIAMDDKLYREFLNNLKEKYPKGRFSNLKFVKKQGFQYISDKLTIFIAASDIENPSDPFGLRLYFYEPKMLNEAINYFNGLVKAIEEEEKKEKKKAIKGKF